MKTQSVDTHPAAEAVQIDLLRKAGVARRFALTASLTQTTIELSRRALRLRYPNANEEEIALMFVSLNYGDDLAGD
jgi:hypothetical protein